MLYPDNRIQPVAPGTDYAEVTAKSPISPTAKVTPGSSGMQLDYPGRQPAEGKTELPEAIVEAPPYTGAERRKVSRRVSRRDPLLDTRSGRDRRKSQTTADGKPLNINDEA
jgi:hypothetical protein